MIADANAGRDSGDAEPPEDTDPDHSRAQASRTAGREREIRQVIYDLALLADKQRPQ